MTTQQVESVIRRYAADRQLDPLDVMTAKDTRQNNYAIARCRGAIGRELLQYGFTVAKIARLFRQGWTVTYEQIHQRQQTKRRKVSKNALAQASADAKPTTKEKNL